jgi:SRSO17 transposase
LEEVLCHKVDEMLGGDEASLIIDDTSLPKKGTKSVGVAHQSCGALGKQANCQCLVSLTLARDDIPAPLGLRLFLPQSWADDPARCKQAKVPENLEHRPKWRIALDEVDRVRAAGVRFGCVLADAGYGMGAEFRHGLSQRGLAWAVGVLAAQNVYSPDVRVAVPALASSRGRPPVRPAPSELPCTAASFIDQHAPSAASPGVQAPRAFTRETSRSCECAQPMEP